MLWSHTSKTVLIGKQGISCNQGIPAIVFCSRNRVPVAEAIQDRALGSAERRRVGDVSLKGAMLVWEAYEIRQGRPF
jgi:hypothetical protein